MSNALKSPIDSSKTTLVVNIRLRNHSNFIGNVVNDLKDTPKNINLVSSDKKKYRAHMAVISAFSEPIKSALSELPPWCKNHQYPTMKLNKVKGHILKKILQYMYEGETCVDAKNWINFVKSSIKIRVIGIDCHVPEVVRGDISEVTNQNGKNMIQIDTYYSEENYLSAEKIKTKNALKHIGYLNDINGDATTQGDVQSSMVLTKDPMESNNKETKKQELNIDVLQGERIEEVPKEKEVDLRERNQDIGLNEIIDGKKEGQGIEGIWSQVAWVQMIGPTPIHSVKETLPIAQIGNMNDGESIADPLDDEEKEDTEPKTKMNTSKTNAGEENPLKSSSMTDISVLDSQTDKEKARPPSKRLTKPNKNAPEEKYSEDIVVVAGLPIDSSTDLVCPANVDMVVNTEPNWEMGKECRPSTDNHFKGGHGQDNGRMVINEDIKGKDTRADTATDIETNLVEMTPEDVLEIKKSDQMGKVKRTARRRLSDENDHFPMKTNETSLKSQPSDSQRIMEKEKKTVCEPVKRKRKGSKVLQESNSEDFGRGNDDELKPLLKSEEDKSEKGVKRSRKRKVFFDNVKEGETVASTQLPIAATKKAKTVSVNQKNKKLIKKGADESIVEKPDEVCGKSPVDLANVEIAPDEPTYCLCDKVEYGEMIGCDNDLCPIDWFHFDCVQLQGKPRGKWFCPKCRGNKPTVMKPKTKFLKKLEIRVEKYKESEDNMK